MRHIVTPQMMRQAEDQAFHNGMKEEALMEKAASCVVDELERMICESQGKQVAFFCGKGNNGGDGLAAARIYAQRGGKSLIVMREEPSTRAAELNARRAQGMGIPVLKQLPNELHIDAAVDALIGIGLRSDVLSEEMNEDIQLINQLDCSVLAVDIPSGMNALTGACANACVRADTTVSFQWAKTGHCFTPNPELIGRLVVADIGISKYAQGIALIDSLDKMDLPGHLPQRATTAHKGSHGRVLLYCGSAGMAGAAAMAALGCMRAGAGLTYIACEEDIIPILQVLAPNAQCIPVRHALADPPKHDVFLAGCGLGQSDDSYAHLLGLYDPHVPSVLDADALNMLSSRPFGLGQNTVITPHVGEAARLLGISGQEVADDMLFAARKLRERYGAIVALKSHCTVIQDEVHISLNTLASPVLAKGGSGDALAGVIAGLMAQGLKGYEAARTASLWMGMAAQIARQRMGDYAPLTGDILSLLGEASLL